MPVHTLTAAQLVDLTVNPARGDVLLLAVTDEDAATVHKSVLAAERDDDGSNGGDPGDVVVSMPGDVRAYHPDDELTVVETASGPNARQLFHALDAGALLDDGELYDVLVQLCEQHGFVGDHTRDLLDSAVDSIAPDED